MHSLSAMSPSTVWTTGAAAVLLMCMGMGMGMGMDTDMTDGHGHGHEDGHGAIRDHAFLGVMMCILGGIVDNTGVTIQKLAHRNDKLSERPYYRRPLWILGLLLYLTGNISNAVGLSLTPQSDFAAVGALTLVTNAINSKCILNEKLNRTIIAGIAVIISGSLTAVLFGAPGRAVTVESIEHLDVCAIVYVCVLLCLITGLYSVIRVIRRQYRASLHRDYAAEKETETVRLQAMVDPLLESSSSGPDMSEDSHVHLSSEVELSCKSSTPSRVLCVLLPVFAGMIGSLTVLFAKAMTVMVRATFHGDNQFVHWPIYVALFMTALIGATQIHWLNMGLKSFDQLIVVPAFAVSLETFNVLGGLIFYHEDRDFGVAQMILFCIAVLISFAGVTIISIGLQRRSRAPTLTSPSSNT